MNVSASPFRSGRMEVDPAWIDYNGHMNVAYYVLLFDRCVDEAFAEMGLGPDYIKTRGLSFFTAEIHVSYLRELKVGAPVEATMQILETDAKRVRVFMELIHAEEGFVAATAEQMFLHVDMRARRVSPFPPDIAENLERVRAAHAGLPVPERAGRGISLKRG